MKLIAGGDSFIWGSELQDSPNGAVYSLSTFSSLLAKEYNLEYHCVAYPGYSNREIHDNVAENVTRDCVVIVCWTWQSRDNEINSDRWIISLQKHLNDLNIPYLFTCADNCVITNNTMIDYLNWYMFPPGTNDDCETVTPRGFYQWAVENKYSIGPESHPLEQAHHDAFKLIKEKFNEVVKKNN